MDLHTYIKLRWTDDEWQDQMIETTCGRTLFNEVVPNEVGFINEVLTKKALRDIIGMVTEGDRYGTCRAVPGRHQGPRFHERLPRWT